MNQNHLPDPSSVLETMPDISREDHSLDTEETLSYEIEKQMLEEEQEEAVSSGRTISPTRLVMKRFFRSKLSMTGLIILLVLFL